MWWSNRLDSCSCSAPRHAPLKAQQGRQHLKGRSSLHWQAMAYLSAGIVPAGLSTGLAKIHLIRCCQTRSGGSRLPPDRQATRCRVQVVNLKWDLARQQHAVEDAQAARRLCQSQAEEMEDVYQQLHHLQQHKVRP